MSAPDRLYRDAGLATFYDAENGWAADTEYCARLAEGAGAVLDLGCGTGLLLSAIAAPRRVGVDPAAAMLAIARARPGGEGVRWVEADAREVRLGERFDLVVMTGHAFQVFLTDDDQRAVLRTVAVHLAPGGRFVFDSRDPGAREWEEWGPEQSFRRFDHPGLGPVEAWNDVARDAASGIVAYGTHYRLGDGSVRSAVARIRFTDRGTLAARLGEAGLRADEWLGGWDGAPWRPGAREIIPVGRLA